MEMTKDPSKPSILQMIFALLGGLLFAATILILLIVGALFE